MTAADLIAKIPNSEGYVYEVAFQLKGERRFGVLEQYSEEAIEQAKKGLLIVEDGLLPERYLFKPEQLEVAVRFDKPKHVEGLPFAVYGEFDEWRDRATEEAMKVSEELGREIKVGKLLQVPRGDGYASYVVTKVNKTTCRLEWRGFSPDRWVDLRWGYGASVKLSEAKLFI